jgi:hypothetical protein
LNIKSQLEIRNQTKGNTVLHNDPTSCNFCITVSYVVYTVKNNLGSCNALSNDQSVNDICLHDMHMITATVNLNISQNTFLKLLLLNCLSCTEIKSGVPYTCKHELQDIKVMD